MKHVLIITIALFLIVTGCAGDKNTNKDIHHRTELIPEPDKDQREAYEKSMLVKQPDTILSDASKKSEALTS
ncbi:hypothetical protein ACKW6Q_01450 [Chryseobacterium kwangjuense]|uniref:Lipoprotein n=1 Tax=Chryseobacterium kwangjuense TaxID=267125 RepID=A0ABW9JWY6_9FLAO